MNKTFSTVFGSIMYLCLLLLGISGCSTKSQTSQVRIQFPSASPSSFHSTSENKDQTFKTFSQKSSSESVKSQSVQRWNSALNPTNIKDFNCFGIYIGSVEPQPNHVTSPAGAKVFSFGLSSAFHLASSKLQLSIPSGKSKTFYLVGWRTSIASSCSDFSKNKYSLNMSQPFLLGKATADIVSGENVVDISTAFSGAIILDQFLGADFGDEIVAPIANLSPVLVGAPVGATNATTLNVSVGGTDITEYKYKFGETANTDCAVASGYSPTILVSTLISRTLGVDGSYSLCVQGGNGSSWQELSQVLPLVWIKDTIAPSGLVLTINAGSTVTNSLTANINLSVAGADQFYLTNTASCASGGSWQNYLSSSTTTWILGQVNSTAAVYVQARDSAGNISLCSSSTIIHDDQPPSAPASVALGGAAMSLTSSPSINYPNATDAGPSGIMKHQAQLENAADSSVVQPWVDHTSGTSLMGLSLVNNNSYKVRVRAIDNAGNLGATVLSNAFTVTEPLATISGQPIGLSNSTGLSVSIGGSGVSEYKFKIGTASSTDCTSATGFSTVVPLATNITDNIMGIVDGTVKLCVIGGNGSGDWQSFSSATTAMWIKDTQLPSVTIARDMGQMGVVNTVAGGTPAVFLATFSEPVSDVTFANIANSGTATGVNWSVVKIDSLRFLLKAVSAATNGSIRPSLAFGVVADNASNSNLASSGTQIVYHQSGVPVPWKQITASMNGGCGINAKGLIYCWGSNTYGAVGDNSTTDRSVPTLIANGGNSSGDEYLQVSTFADHVCGLTVKGKVFCWGRNDSGQLGSVSASLNPVPIGAGANSSNKEYAQVSAGASHTCGLTHDGEAYCWGAAANGRLGNNLISPNVSAPEAVLNGANTLANPYIQISSGEDHTCALTVKGRVYCWGANNYGQLGNSTFTEAKTPVALAIGDNTTDKEYVKVIARRLLSCGITADGKVYCWGLGDYGQNGDPNGNSNVPRLVAVGQNTSLTEYVDVENGQNTTCALAADGKAYCWGMNVYGQLGNGSTTASSSPILVNNGENTNGDEYTSVAVGGNSACALSGTGALYCWGDNSGSYQLANGSNEEAHAPVRTVSSVKASSEKEFTQLAAGSSHSCGLTSDGFIYCWGSNTSGQLGKGDTTGSLTPLPVSIGANTLSKRYKQVGTGLDYSCGLSVEGKIYCWGNYVNGRLGKSGVSTIQTTPQLVSVGDNSSGKAYIAMSVSENQSCGLTANRKVFCWGANTYGGLGNGTTGAVITPTAIVNGANSGKEFKAIALGVKSTCGITVDGKIYCWGYGSNGALGNGGTGSSTAPVAILDGENTTGVAYSKLSFKGFTPCATSAGGILYCWGQNSAGQVGVGDTTNYTIPKAVAGANSFRMFNSGIEHTCGVTFGGSLYCWGLNGVGQVGDNSSGTNRTTPVAVVAGDNSSAKVYIGLSGGNSHTLGLTVDGKYYGWGSGLDGRLGNNSTVGGFYPLLGFQP